MRSWLLGLGVMVGVGCGTLRKPPEPDRRLDVRLHGAVFQSDTGYQFAAFPEPNSGVIRLTVRYPVGSIDDPPGKEGLAHLAEHLLFQVEVPREGGKSSIGAELGRLALWTNAATSPDHTSYEALLAPSSLDAVIGLEVERLLVGCAGLTPAAFEREREVVLNELRERQGSLGAELTRQIYAAVYPEKHPYRAVDSVESVSRLTLGDVCGFLVGPYRKGRVIIIASGEVTAPALQEAASHHLGRAPKRDAAVTRAPPPVVAAEPKTLTIRGDVDEPILLATWPLPPVATREYRMLQMATGAIASRMEAFALTYNWGHSAFSLELGGVHAPVLAAAITLNGTGDLDEAKSSAKKAAEYAARTIARPGDDRDSVQWRYQWQASAESVLARWESLGARNATAADILELEPEPSPSFVVGRVDELVKAHPRDVHDLVGKWLDPKRARFILIEPSGGAVRSRSKQYTGSDEEHAVFVDVSGADKPLPAPTIPPLRTERYTTENGLSVVLWPHGDASVVHGALVIDSGQAHEPPGKEGISAFVGAGDIDEDVMTYTNRQLSTRVDDLVEALALELRSPGYELSDEVKGVLRGRLRLTRAKERTKYVRDFFGALYGANHPYARDLMTEASLSNISRDSVMSWAREHVVPGNAALVIAGKFDPALVKKHIAYNTDQLSRGSDSTDPEVEPVTRRAFIAGITDKPSPTLEITVSFVGGEGIDRDHAKRLVLEQVLAAQLAQLRAKRALTYGFTASYTSRRAGGLWTIGGDVDATRAAEASTAVLTILETLRASPDSYRGAFVLGRQRALESLLVNATSSSAVVAQLAELARFDLPDPFHQNLAIQIANITLADFHAFLVHELARDHQVFGAFGNADAAAAAVKAAAAVQPAAKSIVDPFQ